MPNEPILTELQKVDYHLHAAFRALNAEQFLVESTENLRQAREELKQAGLLLQQQLQHLKTVKEEL